MPAAAANNNDQQDDVYNDLKGFLLADRVDLRQEATKAFLQVRDFSSLQRLVQHDGLVKALAQNASHSDDVVAVQALEALVYLSSHGPSASQCVDELIETKIVSRLLEVILTTKILPVGDNKIIKVTQDNQKSEKLESKSDQEKARSKVNYAMALLANVTRVEQAAVELVGHSLPDHAIFKESQQLQPVAEEETENNNHDSIKQAIKDTSNPGIRLLLARFMNQQFVRQPDNNEYYTNMSESDLDNQTNDPFQHFAAVIMNIAHVEVGRQFLLQKHYRDRKDGQGWTLLQSLLPMIIYPASLSAASDDLSQPNIHTFSVNPIRRRGIAGAIRNCCLDQDSSWWLLNVVEIGRVYLLYPLAGPEELTLEEKKGLHPDLWMSGVDQVREPDRWTRLYVAEAFYLLCCASRSSRRRLYQQDRAHVIIKIAAMVEEEEDVSEQLSNALERLEGYQIEQEQKHQSEGHDGENVEDNDDIDDDDDDDDDKAFDLDSHQPSLARQVGASTNSVEDYDNVD